MTQQLQKAYEPREVEARWYKKWVSDNYFHAEPEPDKQPFCIVIPPPNVTGKLHLGHALDNTLQDILIRWRRMRGDNTLWIPGTDHAGIATQAKVEEQLAKEGKSRYDLGREAFLERVWEWKEQYGGTIINQLKGLGASCDWERERFTMDEGCSRAVREVFVRLYEKGLIYRGSYLVNWCPKCNTTISDIEVEHEEREGSLWHIRYPYADGSGFIEVATTRPETMLGDTAVAVHPDDERYHGKIGKMVVLPLLNREIPVVADEYVDMSFGTGAVKITPAHDINDFEMGLRHQLPKITVIGFDAKMNEHAGPYEGLDRYECRRRVIADLEERGLLVKEESHSHAVGQCYRCDTVIEPLVSKQWFVKMEPAIKAAETGQIHFVPERFTKIYLGWLENIRDWCISRQLWWGHRIPVWYCDCGEMIVAIEDPKSCLKCGSSHLQQDEDVLDTWFSSALWPFSTMGWPEETALQKQFYPTSVLVTGRDIIFFWVARMIFMGLEFKGIEPFKDVLIHGLVLDKHGKKMSKSRPETIVDPQDIIDKMGADTLRFTLATGTSLGQDQRFQLEKVEGVRNFINKIWNAARFVLMNLEDYSGAGTISDPDQFSLVDRWILSRMQRVTDEVSEMLERYDMGGAANLLYEFTWSEYCDWYIELAKPRLKEGGAGRQVTQEVLISVLRQILELLHPYIPFVTEEIWQAIPHEGTSIMIAPWPTVSEELLDAQAEMEMGLIMELVRAIRNIRAETGVEPAKRIEAIIMANPERSDVVKANEIAICTLAGIGELKVELEESEPPTKAVSAVAGGVQVFLPIAGLVDLELENQRLVKELATVQDEIKKLEGKLGNSQFVEKAPAAVVEKERQKLVTAQEKAEKIEGRLKELA